METGMKANAVPIPAMTNGPARLSQRSRAGTWVENKIQAPMSAMPKAHDELGRGTGDQLLGQPGEG